MARKKAPADPFLPAATGGDRPDIEGIPIVSTVATDVKPTMIPYTTIRDEKTDQDKLVVAEFYRLPQWMLEANYAELSSDAKILYAAMLNTLSLSARNGKRDSSGALYVHYTIQHVQALFRCGHTKASALLQELRQWGLIRRFPQGLGKPARVYLYHPKDVQTDKADTGVPAKVAAPPEDDPVISSATTLPPQPLSKSACYLMRPLA